MYQIYTKILQHITSNISMTLVILYDMSMFPVLIYFSSFDITKKATMEINKCAPHTLFQGYPEYKSPAVNIDRSKRVCYVHFNNVAIHFLNYLVLDGKGGKKGRETSLWLPLTHNGCRS